MESLPSRKNSRGSRAHSGSDKSGSRSSSSLKKSSPIPAESDVEEKVVDDKDIEDLVEDDFLLEDTDSEDSELDVNKDEDEQTDEQANDFKAVEKADEDASNVKDNDINLLTSEDDMNDNSKELKPADEGNEEEEESQEDSKKRGRKLKKQTEKRTGFDGREVVFVTECTQTDWRWRDKAEKTGKAKLVASTSDIDTGSTRTESGGIKSILVKTDYRDVVSRTVTEFESTIDDRTTIDVTPFSLQPNDEFGIPLLDMSSDSDSSDDDVPKKVKSHRHHLPTIGPPQILKYVRESERMNRNSDRTSSELDDRLLESTDYPSSGPSPGMFGGICEFCGKDIKPFPTLDQQLSLPPESLHCCDEYREFVEFAMTTANRLEEDLARKHQKIDIKVHGHHGSKQARKMAKEQAVQRMRERELQRRQQEATGMQAAYFNLARQMKTINYQLSSQRCLEEGWTLRAPSPLDLDDIEAEVYIPEPLHPAMIATGKLHHRKLILKYYPDGSKFLTVFPDGTGNIFYPSGNLAILITSVNLGQYSYIVLDDSKESGILAVFEPTGYGCCYFANGKIRLNYDQMIGLELDFNGGRKRIWSWKDQETHVHAPPFQPIVFGMNRYIGIRFMSQESIALTLTGRKRSCRFNVGAKLKLVAPENLQPKSIDEDQLYIDERKVRVDHILNKVSTLLKFPKSPKVDRILPPLSVRSRQQKIEKLKDEYVSNIQMQNAMKKSKKRVKSSRLSPIPVVSVN